MILNMIIHRSFSGATHLLSANVQGTVSFVVSVYTYIYIYIVSVIQTMVEASNQIVCLRLSVIQTMMEASNQIVCLCCPDYDGNLKSDSVPLLSRL